MPNDTMTNQRAYFKSRVQAALETIQYHATDRPAGIHIWENESDGDDNISKKPGVFYSIDMSYGEPKRYESGEYKDRPGQVVVQVYLHLALVNQGSTTLSDMYDSLQELIQYALETTIPGSVAQSDYYIIEFDRIALVAESPLFDDSATTGFGQLTFTLNYNITRRE